MKKQRSILSVISTSVKLSAGSPALDEDIASVQQGYNGSVARLLLQHFHPVDAGFEEVPELMPLPWALLLDVIERRVISTGQVEPDKVGHRLLVLGKRVEEPHRHGVRRARNLHALVGPRSRVIAPLVHMVRRWSILSRQGLGAIVQRSWQSGRAPRMGRCPMVRNHGQLPLLWPRKC